MDNPYEPVAYLGFYGRIDFKKENTMTKLWIDDLRPAPDGWHWVKSSHEALEYLEKNHETVTHVSFDHDLGGDDTSRPVALWLAEHDRFPAYVYIHTANVVGKKWLFELIDHYGPRPMFLDYKAN